MSRKNKVVYAWYDEEEIFYIGIGTKRRVTSKSSRNPLCKNKMNKAIRNNSFNTKILFANLTHEEACEIEKDLIQFHGRRDLDTGCLTNMTDGGDGIHNLSPESRKKISESQLGEKNHRWGKTNSTEWVEMMKELHSGKNNCNYGKDMSGVNNPMYGIRGEKHPLYKIPRPQEVKDKIGLTNGKTVHTPLGIFSSNRLAAEAHNLAGASSIQSRVMNKNYPNYYYI